MFQDKNSMEYCTFNNILNNAFKYSKGAGDIILGFCYHEYSYWTLILEFKSLNKINQNYLILLGSNTDGDMQPV
jgi:hypothetical protein